MLCTATRKVIPLHAKAAPWRADSVRGVVGHRSARLMELYRERQELRDEERRREHQAAQQLCCSMADDGDDRSPASKAQSGSPIRSSASPTRAKPATKRCSSPVQCFLKSHPKHAHRISTQDLVAASLELRMI
jgi:hypothetical protein